MQILQQISTATGAVADKIGSAVVSIGRDSRGAGVDVAPGAVVTNAHNLRDRTTSVTFADGRTAQAQAQGVDVDGDLGVLTVETGDVAAAEWGDAGTITAGTPVFGIARRGSNGLRTTFGTMSATEQTFRGPRRRVTGAFEHTAPLGRGFSGGPVTDADGQLLGINTKRLGDGLYLAVPATAELRVRVDALGRGGVPRRRRLGVGLAPSYVANRAAHLSQAARTRKAARAGGLEGGPAEAAGLQTGDLLVAVDGRPLARIDDLLTPLDADPADASLLLTVVGGVDEREVSLSFHAGDAGEAAEQ